MSFLKRGHQARFVLWAIAILFALSLLSACLGDPSGMPILGNFLAPTATYTPSPTSPPTNTPLPTPTLKAGETPIPPTPTPQPTPQVTIPKGFKAVKDDRLKYSFALPRGWTLLDLRSAQFQNMANQFGMGPMMGDLNKFLDSDQAEPLGVIYIADIANAMFGGLPSAINVSVIDAAGQTPETAKGLVEGVVKANTAMLGDAVKMDPVEATTINNLPAVKSSATANLAKFGVNASMYIKVVGLIANEKIYVMVLATQDNQRGAKEPQFDQIIGTFRPE